MTDDTMSTVCTINAPAETVFAVLADPTTHQTIDGTGWVREPLDDKRLTAVGQIFRMAMYHDNYGGMHYEMANRVEVFEPPHAIAWLPGQGADDANLDFGGWIWRYDLEPLGADRTKVTLTYDWSAVPPAIRDHISFPPFDRQHLDNSLKHLAGLAQDRT
ncbi:MULTISPECIES: SRPBCC family protein [unclassified Mycobacterium]|uniref:SRPBCC family protein n=1 Tax=unclassified Mycobacterium TaxID=2642494 RepID=UPI0007401A4A|nr:MULTISPECIES: SRPBCC family protein [unclassified Mycobacterium]KUH81597.1 polyketide cyclase [Mycobacterium sp. GA-0227b]KUH83724.1 polyketide cyclase [Mycobacterium sp. GA-1999]